MRLDEASRTLRWFFTQVRWKFFIAGVGWRWSALLYYLRLCAGALRSYIHISQCLTLAPKHWLSGYVTKHHSTSQSGNEKWKTVLLIQPHLISLSLLNAPHTHISFIIKPL